MNYICNFIDDISSSNYWTVKDEQNICDTMRKAHRERDREKWKVREENKEEMRAKQQKTSRNRKKCKLSFKMKWRIEQPYVTLNARLQIFIQKCTKHEAASTMSDCINI